MPDPEPMPAPPSAAGSGLRLADTVGLVAGYGLASLLARSVWPGYSGLAGAPLAAFALEFAWLGLAMSGPVLLVLGRLGSGQGPKGQVPPRRPARLGRPIGEVPVGDRWAKPMPVSVPGPAAGTPAARPEWSRAEMAWLAIGSYWISLTLFMVGARAAPGAFAALIPMIAIVGLIVLVPVGLRRRRSPPARGWTHAAALGLLWTWPVAWGLLVLLGRTL